jgi:hypothetical protein
MINLIHDKYNFINNLIFAQQSTEILIIKLISIKQKSNRIKTNSDEILINIIINIK